MTSEMIDFDDRSDNNRLVDDAGKPLVLYHGTQAAPFETFKPSGEHNLFGDGEQYHFTDDYAEARGYARGNADTRSKGRSGTGRVMRVHLTMIRPADLRADSWNVDDVPVQDFLEQIDIEGLVEALRQAGYDGIIHDGEFTPVPCLGNHYVVFSPDQIQLLSERKPSPNTGKGCGDEGPSL